MDNDALNLRYEAALSALQSGALEEASALSNAILAENSGHVPTLHLLSSVHLQRGKPEVATQFARRATVLAPEEAVYRNGLGLALLASGKNKEAVDAFRSAVELQPTMVEAFINQAIGLQHQGNLEDAYNTLEHALQIEPENVKALVNKSITLVKMGMAEDAIECIETARRRNPTSLLIARNLLGLLNYSPHHTTDQDFAQIMHSWRLVDSVRGAAHPYEHKRDTTTAPNRPIHIGYVSADFRSHVIGDLIQPILAAHDKSAFHITLYSNSSIEDETTDDLKSHSHVWRSIAGLSDEDAAQRIFEDKVDILIDLTGHTEGGRLGVFRLKPAPIQITWMGYVATTGLPQMDYIIADRHVLPDCNEKYFVEKPIHMPHTYYCFKAPDRTELWARTPRGEKHGITFGSLNNTLKINSQVAKAWAKIMQKVPHSRLIVKYATLSDDFIAYKFKSLLVKNGINSERIQFLGRTNRQDHMAVYKDVDIALDPFPYGGGMTTFEALAMSVPVITIKGESWASRASASILATVGLEELVAKSVEEYIQYAVDLAQDTSRLKALNRNTRILMESSPVCDTHRFTRTLETQFQTIWKSWCAAKT